MGGNLLSDAGTANAGITAFKLDDRVDKFLRWSFRAGPPMTSRREEPPIFGYYTLAATSIALDQLPPEKIKRLPRYQSVPAILIGRLAVDVNYRGRGIGSALVVDAVTRTDRFGIGAFALIVDAKDKAARAFYEANGFVGVLGEERRMFLEMAVAMAGFR